MNIDCVSDLHGEYPELPGGDLLIVAGDLTGRDLPYEYIKFVCWIANQKYKHRIFIGGNHDNQLVGWPSMKYAECDYLFDSGTEFSYDIPGFPEEDEKFLPNGKRTLKIWGSPWTKSFPGMNPHCKAFTLDTEEQLAEKWALIPDDTDILVTHSPFFGIGDLTPYGEHVGSTSLLTWIASHSETLKLHVCGHIHGGYGVYDIRNLQKSVGNQLTPVYVNASHLNDDYEAVNQPIRVIL